MRKRRLLIAITILLLTLVAGVWLTGTVLTAPARQSVGAAPSELNAEAVEFQSRSGATIKGWFSRGKKDAGAIVLMHGNRANRLSMVDRARFLSRAGFSVLLFDFQAHGESSGDYITFGYLESKDAQAAVDFLRANAPGEKIGVIGMPPSLAPQVCDEVLCEQYWHGGELVAPANVCYFRFGDTWHRLTFDHGIIFWRRQAERPKPYTMPELDGETRIDNVGESLPAANAR